MIESIITGGEGSGMEKKSIWKRTIVPSALFLLAFGLYVGYSSWDEKNNEDVRKIHEAVAASKEANEDIASFQQDSANKDFKSVGSFISKFHQKYNKSLGWGGIDSVKWDAEMETAAEINSIIKGIQTDNGDLQADFKAISEYAKMIGSGERDKKALLKLHRYFHDLDIEVNGYKDTNDYFDVTEYKRSENG